MKAKLETGSNVSSFFREVVRDRSTAALLLANLAAIVAAVIRGSDLFGMLWIYWAQNLVIGFFQFLTILSLKRFSTKGMVVDGRPVDEAEIRKVPIAFFFLAHYGFFHVIYAFFILSGLGGGRTEPSTVRAAGFPTLTQDNLLVAASILAFVLSQLYTFWRDRKRNAERKPSLVAVVFFPYARIVPMHLTILLGGGLLAATGSAGVTPVAVFFMVLKTAADLAMQAIERRAAGQWKS